MEEEKKTTARHMCCRVCDLRFNLDKRMPITMVCCGETACKQCVQNKMIKSSDHKFADFVIQGQIQCSFCKSDKYYNIVETPKEIPLLVNQYLKSMLEKEKLFPTLIYCKQHPETLVTNYCKNHNSMVCKECLLSEHSDHLQQ